MSIRNTSTRWGHLAQFLHWLIVILIITQVILASIAEDLPIGPKKIEVYAWHKSVGITILSLAIIRLLWRWANPTPELPSTLKPYERALAKVTHFGLYLLLFASTYFVMERASAANFTEALTRTDALYFSVTVFTTVGFGDIAAKSETARIALIVQMLADLALLGAGARVLLGAVRRGQQRRTDSDGDGGAI